MKDYWEKEREFWNKDQVIYFGLCYNDDWEEWEAMFVPKNFWDEKKHFPDQHVLPHLEITHGLGFERNDVSETMENVIAFSNLDYDAIIEYLTILGFTHNPELDCGEIK